MHAALNSSVKMDWQTPDSLLELVRKVSRTGHIGLDPCTSAENPTEALRFRTEQHPDGGGLGVAWWPYSGAGVTYVNPPYGRALGEWTRKCCREAATGVEIILLTPARPDTIWFQDTANFAACKPTVLFWKGRLKYKGARDAAPFPSALFYWGPRHERFREVFAGRGLFL